MAKTAERLRDQVMPDQRDLAPEIIAAAQTGDHAAFEAIFNQYHHPIYNHIHRKMGIRNPEDALDFTQDTFLRAYEALPRTAPGLEVGPWLYRIATNVSLDALRHRKLIHWQPWETFMSRFHPSQASNEDPEQDVLNKEKQERVQLIINRLQPKCRTVLILSEYQDLSHEEIAEALNTTRSAVKSLLWRAREQFRQAYVYEAHVQRRPVSI